MNDVAIEIKDLSKKYGDIIALDGATLEAARGQVFGLVGPNGAGKTTLIKAMCGILKPDAGSVMVLGLNPASDRHAIRRRLGYMPQTPSLYEDLSPRENLRFFGSAFHPPGLQEQIESSLKFVQLWERRDDPLHTFSGGMRQRASLACALLHDPELLVLDEPTAGVDPTLKQNFWEHFRSLSDQGRTIFMSTNQMDEALRCDRVAVIRGGRVLISKAPEVIRARGKARIVLELEDGRQVHEVANYAEELPRLLSGYGLSPRVKGITVRRQSLEEVILAMIEDEE